MTTLTLTVPGRPISANDRLHWRAKAAAVKHLRHTTIDHALEQWGIPARWPKLRYPVDITVQDHCRTANLRDTSQAAPAVKAIIDGLTDAGLWPDDSARHVAAIHFLPATKTGHDALVLTITDSRGTA